MVPEHELEGMRAGRELETDLGLTAPEVQVVIRFRDGERSRRIFRTTQLLADNFEASIAARPTDWHMLQRLWVDDLDPSKAPA